MASERERVAWELCGGHCACRKVGILDNDDNPCAERGVYADRAIALGARAPDPVEELIRDVSLMLHGYSVRSPLLLSDLPDRIVRHVLANAPRPFDEWDRIAPTDHSGNGAD